MHQKFWQFHTQSPNIKLNQSSSIQDRSGRWHQPKTIGIEDFMGVVMNGEWF